MAPSGPSYASVAVFSTTFEGILYGFSVLMFALTIWILISKRGLSTSHHKIMFATACLLFVISTIHMSVNIDHFYEGFIRYSISDESGQYLANVSTRTFVVKDVAFAAQILVGDAVVIYRAYIVWRSYRAIVVPVLLYLVLIISSVGSIYALASAQPPQAYDIFQDESTGIWIKLHLAATLACNFLSTCNLAFKLWLIERNVSGIREGPQSSLTPVLRVVIDSGLLYSITLLSALICFATKSRAEYFVYDIITPIISISFYAVILRVALVNSNRQWSQTSSFASPSLALSIPERSNVGSSPSSSQLLSEANSSSLRWASEDSSGKAIVSDRRVLRESDLTEGESYALRPIRVHVVRESLHDDSVDVASLSIGAEAARDTT